MTNPGHASLVEVTRGNIVESVHFGSLAVAKPDGTILLALGDSTNPFFLRSSAKPFQALAFFERGGAAYYQLEEEEIAIICASHSGTPEHLQVLQMLQHKTGVREEELQCGAHMPYHRESEVQLLIEGKQPHSNHNNCSGKHTGMLAFAKMIGVPTDNYLDLQNPVQQAILTTFAQMCAVNTENIELGMDGCTAPVFAVPLPVAAAAFARLCQPEGMAEDRANACRLITQAMPAHSFLVAGPERFDTDLMAAAGGTVVSKIGAEGYFGMGVLPGRAAGIKESVGIAIKISEGDLTHRAFSVVALAVLAGLGVLGREQFEKLQNYGQRPVKNWRCKEVGEIRPSSFLVQALKSWSV